VPWIAQPNLAAGHSGRQPRQTAMVKSWLPVCLSLRELIMFTIRNLGGVALFLFGTTYLWLTPMFASKDVSTKGLAWSITNVMAYVTIVGFTIATVGLFRKATWWQGVAIASAVIGLIVLIPYWIAAHSSGETTPWFNVLIHAICAIAVLPALSTWVNGHVMAGR
jgi:hypothetical protein